MTEQEIIKAITKVEELGEMTVNERLYVCGLMDEFDKALIVDKDKAKKILELLGVDKPSIEKIVALWKLNLTIWNKTMIFQNGNTWKKKSRLLFRLSWRFCIS